MYDIASNSNDNSRLIIISISFINVRKNKAQDTRPNAGGRMRKEEGVKSLTTLHCNINTMHCTAFIIIEHQFFSLIFPAITWATMLFKPKQQYTTASR